MPDTHPARPLEASEARGVRTRQPRVPSAPVTAVRHDPLLGAVARAAEVLTATPDLRAALAEAGRVLGEATGVDRVNVFRYDHAGAASSLHAEWARPGVTPLSAVDAGPYADADYAEVLRPLRAGQVYHSPLREKTGANAALNAAAATKTDLFVPVVVDGRFWGMLNFDDCTAERAWSDGEVEVLRAAAAAVAAAVWREALERAHAEALASEREQAAVARAAALTAANARLAKRLHLVEAAVETADALLAAPAVGGAMPAVLARLGRALGADRALLMRFTPPDAAARLGWAMLDHEWTAPGISRQADDPALARLNLEHYADIVHRLHRERFVVVHTPDLPEAARAEQEAAGARSQVVITVMDGGRVWGFLGFDDCRTDRPWDEAEVGLVQIVAASLGGALEREALGAARAAAERAVLAEREQAAEARAVELARANAALRDREALLAAAAEASRLLLESGDVWGTLPRALARLGQVAGWDRTALLLSRPDAAGRPGHAVAAEWAAEGVPAQLGHPTHGWLADADVPEVAAEIRAGRAVWITRDDMALPTRETFDGIDVQTTVAVPVFVDGAYVGAVGFDDGTRRRPRQAHELDALETAARVVAAAVQRERLVDEVTRERERAAEARAAELARANEALQAVTDALTTARGHDDIVPTVLRIAAATFGVETAAFFEHPGDTVYLRYWLHEGRVLRPAELLALDPMGRHAVPRRLAAGFTVPAAYLGGTSPSARTRAVAIDHAVGTAEPDFDAWTRVHDWELELNVPCVVGGIARGALVLYRGAGAAYTPAEVALAEALAKQLALAMEADRLAREVREQAVESAVAHERQQAAEARTAELERAHAILRGGLDAIAAAPTLDRVLDAFVLAAVRVAGATGGGVLRRVGGGTEFAFTTIAHGARLDDGSLAAAFVAATPAISRRDPAGYFGRIVAGELFANDVHALTPWFPEAVAYHRQAGNACGWCVPFRVGGQVAGYVGLAFAEWRDPDPETKETLTTLAAQAGLALDLRRKSADAEAAAVARERERAAEARAAELANANAALRGTVAALASGRGLDAFRASVLREAARQTGAVATAVFLHDAAEDTLRLVAAWADGHEAAPDAAWLAPFRAPTPGAAAPAWRALLAREEPLLVHAVDDAALTWPSTRAMHGGEGHRALGYLRLQVGDRPLGFVGLAWREAAPALGPERGGVLAALAQQLALALELDRLAAEAVTEQQGAAVLEERTRLAREVHDTIAQGLAGVVMQLAAARAALGASEGPARPTLDRVDRLARETLAEARRSIAMLRPAALEHRGLDAAIREAVDGARDAVAGRGPSPAAEATDAGARDRPQGGGTRVALDIRGTPARLPADVEMELLRIAQGALANAVQHAHAAEIRVELAVASRDGVARDVRLSVTDDGRGFDSDAAHPARFGLVGMSERAVRVGAVLTVVTAPGEGTDVVVMWRAAESDGPAPGGLRPGAPA